MAKWALKKNDADIGLMSQTLRISPVLATVLVNRGIRSKHEAIKYLNPAMKFLNVDDMAGMREGVELISVAVESGARIAEIYIPGRLGEGYGLNRPALDVLKANGVGLVITVDCGITAIEEARYAHKLGLGLVITDHHECRAELPEADAVVDPKRPDCGYPHKSLAGVGVAFKLVCALESDAGSDEMFRRYGDLVAVGTIADVMPVGGENRELIRRGLAILNTAPRPGLLCLLREAYPERGRVTTATVGFTLAPRLNAAGRMGQPDLSVDLLLTDDYSEAETLTAELCRLNTERRSLELDIYEEAAAMLPPSGPEGPIILAQRGWFQGVTGIVAAKMAELYLIPTVIISIDENGIGRGSCRSFGEFGIYGALRSCEDILDNYGGHEMAAGVTISEANIDKFRERITRFYTDSYKIVPTPSLKLDFEVGKPELLTAQNVEALERLEPFGNGYPPPCLCITDALITSMHSIGAGKHSRLRIDKSGWSFDCIYFSMPSEDLGVSTGMLVDIAFEPQINEFRGRADVQLHLFDIRMSGI
jgi:single-stranded-DNA-specific exonuclease